MTADVSTLMAGVSSTTVPTAETGTTLGNCVDDMTADVSTLMAGVSSTTVPTAETGTTLGAWADLMEDLMSVLTGDAARNNTESGGCLGYTAKNLVERIPS